MHLGNGTPEQIHRRLDGLQECNTTFDARHHTPWDRMWPNSMASDQRAPAWSE